MPQSGGLFFVRVFSEAFDERRVCRRFAVDGAGRAAQVARAGRLRGAAEGHGDGDFALQEENRESKALDDTKVENDEHRRKFRRLWKDLRAEGQPSLCFIAVRVARLLCASLLANNLLIFCRLVAINTLYWLRLLGVWVCPLLM